jgi:hypothetical protein
VIALSGALLVVGALLLVAGLFAGAGLLYASIAVVLVAAALLPLGVVRALDREVRTQ